MQAVGEPPLFLGASVAFAIRDAIAYVRREAGESECFTLDSPVTCERIRMACTDHITKQVAMHAYMNTHIHNTHTYTYILHTQHTCACTHARTRTHTHAHAHTHTHACI